MNIIIVNLYLYILLHIIIVIDLLLRIFRARPYHRMKLMLVGKAGRGKTTLLRKISEKGQSGIQENLFLTRMSSEAKRFQRDLSTGKQQHNNNNSIYNYNVTG